MFGKKQAILLHNLKNLLFLFSACLLIYLITLYYDYSITKKQLAFNKVINNFYFKKTKDLLLENIKSNFLNISHEIKSGENFVQILRKYNIPDNQIKEINQEISKFTKLKKLKIGNIIEITIKEGINKTVENLIFPVSNTIKIAVERDIKNNLLSQKIVTKLFKKNILKQGIIKKSLYNSAVSNNVNPNIIIEFARIYGFEIDFQRDIRKGDTFQILHEIYVDEYGDFYETGNIIFASMNVQNKDISLYKFNKKKFEGFYNINGKSVQKALMKTPINGARLSSSYGLRKHPILGFNKMHRGTDFAAPLGTAIMASGTGKIIKAGWCGGGGNCIKIKHNSTYSTVYAHLSKFSKWTKVGKRIKQGQIIGYVGSTGLSTGPHLHYEVHINGKSTNSQKLNLPSGKILKGKQRRLFELERIKIDVLLSDIISKKNSESFN